MTDAKKIITLTLDPSLDRTLATHYLAVGYHNQTEAQTSLHPAGKSVNIARAINQLGVYTHAIIVLGEDATGRAYQLLVQEEGYQVSIIRRPGYTRSNTIILDTGNQNETQITEAVAAITQATLEEVSKTLKGQLNPDDWVVYAGAMPEGTETHVYSWLTETAQSAGANVTVAEVGGALSDVLTARPNRVAMRRLEGAADFNYPVRTLGDLYGCGQALIKDGAQHVLMIMRPTNEAILLTGSEDWHLQLPELDSGTQSGLWDTVLAGYLTGRINQQDHRDALATAAAAAHFFSEQVGHVFGSLEDIAPYREAAQVRPVDEVLAEREERGRPDAEQAESS
ncbi:MAG: hypothetical protein GYB68_13625 [Chloroflexi bacterium]|nr:hypothetical protein [Chloroflexota bacterium]